MKKRALQKMEDALAFAEWFGSQKDGDALLVANMQQQFQRLFVDSVKVYDVPMSKLVPALQKGTMSFGPIKLNESSWDRSFELRKGVYKARLSIPFGYGAAYWEVFLIRQNNTYGGNEISSWKVLLGNLVNQ
ncbi:MAG: hypothetical protein AAF206_12565 [Bacteroidota bacterium]